MVYPLIFLVAGFLASRGGRKGADESGTRTGPTITLFKFVGIVAVCTTVSPAIQALFGSGGPHATFKNLVMELEKAIGIQILPDRRFFGYDPEKDETGFYQEILTSAVF